MTVATEPRYMGGCPHPLQGDSTANGGTRVNCLSRNALGGSVDGETSARGLLFPMAHARMPGRAKPLSYDVRS
jgi:hypothetical protein